MPGLAAAWETSPDGRRWTFHLREGLRWSDGTPLSAKDLAWSWRRALDPRTGGEFGYLLDRVRHAAAWRRSGEGEPRLEPAPLPSRAAVEEARAHFGIDQGAFAADDRTLVVELDGYVPWLLDLLAMPFAAPVHRASVERGGPTAFLPGKLVSSGAFRLEAGPPDGPLRLRRSPSYWDDAATACETVEVASEEDPAAAIARYEDGRADWLPWVGREAAARTPPRSDLVQSPSGILYLLRVQTPRPALSDARVRRALSRAIDRDRLFAGPDRIGVPTANVVPPGLPGYESAESTVGFDLPAARRLLEAAGYPGGRGFPRLTYLLNQDVGHRRTAEEIARQWKEHLGVETTLRVESWQDYQELLARGEFDVARGGWIGDYPDPTTFLGLFRAEDRGNQTGWSDPLYERLLDLATDPVAGSRSLAGDAGPAFFARLRDPAGARADFDPAGDLSTAAKRARLEAWRMRLLREAEAILVQDAVPAIPLCVYVRRELVAPRVEGHRKTLRGPDGRPLPNLAGVHPLRALRARKG